MPLEKIAIGKMYLRAATSVVRSPASLLGAANATSTLRKSRCKTVAAQRKFQ